MKDRLVQQELFKEFQRPKKKDSTSLLPKSYTLFNVTYEQIIFISIAIIMLMVLLFSLGVERGKDLVSSNIKKIEIKPITKTPTVADVKEEPTKKKEMATVKTIEPIEEPVKEPVEEKKVLGSKPFTIQVIAYRSKRSAQDELIRLNKKGFDPFIIVGGGYYQICVGEYSTKDEAKKGLLGLKKAYKDSFIRKR